LEGASSTLHLVFGAFGALFLTLTSPSKHFH
jgi:hypothetical protein